MSGSASWNYRMKTLVEIGKIVYLKHHQESMGQFRIYGNGADQENRVSRISVGTNLYF